MNDQQKQFVKKVAKDSYNNNINFDEIREAYKLITGLQTDNRRAMRIEMFNIHTRPEILDKITSTGLDNDNLNNKEALPTPQRFLDKQKLYAEALNGDIASKNELQEVYNKEHDLMEAKTKALLNNKKVDKRSKAYRDSIGR